jgi:hypothetical protein
VDDYIVDADISRIGADHYSGSEFTGEWKNGVPPIEWRTYSMSRHRAFGFTVFDEQLRYSPIKNIVQEYTGRKMQTTVLRDHDKYCLLAAISGHMTGKLVPRTAGDTPTPGHDRRGEDRLHRQRRRLQVDRGAGRGLRQPDPALVRHDQGHVPGRHRPAVTRSTR